MYSYERESLIAMPDTTDEEINIGEHVDDELRAFSKKLADTVSDMISREISQPFREALDEAYKQIEDLKGQVEDLTDQLADARDN